MSQPKIKMLQNVGGDPKIYPKVPIFKNQHQYECFWQYVDIPSSVDTSVSFELYGHLVRFRLEHRGHHGLIAAIFSDFVRRACRVSIKGSNEIVIAS